MSKPPAGILSKEQIDAIIEGVRDIGHIQVKNQNKAMEVSRKPSDGSPVTIMDTKSDGWLRLLLDGVRPNTPIVSEEAPLADNLAAMRSPGEVWMLDPLDGTKHYINGEDKFAINIALLGKPDSSGARQPVFGLVYFPRLKMVYYTGAQGTPMRGILASDDGGPLAFAEHDGKPEHHAIALRHPLPQEHGKFSVLHVGIGLHHARGSEFFQPYAHKTTVSEHPNAYREALIAQGSLDAGICDHACSLWDVAATDALLRAAGGRMLPLNTDATAIAGSAIDYRANLTGGVGTFEVPPHISIHPDIAKLPAIQQVLDSLSAEAAPTRPVRLI